MLEKLQGSTTKVMKKTLYTNTTTPESERHANSANRIAGKESTTMQKRQPKLQRAKTKKQPRTKGKQKVQRHTLERLGPGLGRLLPTGYKHVKAWAELVERPFVGENGVKCPFNFNPSPSLMSVNATTVNYENSLSVTQGQTRQVCAWPGHYPMANIPAVVGTTGSTYAAQMDEVAYHQGLVGISGGTNYNVGPCGSNTGAGNAVNSSACMYSASTASAANGVVVPTTAGHTNMGWDNPFPVNADISIGGHLRWKMISMGIRIRNTTPAASRGGSIVSVQPTFQINVADYGNQAAFSKHPSFRVWGDGTEEVTITWIPRPRDLSYWHLDNNTAATSTDFVEFSISGPGILIWLNAPAVGSQTYEFTQVAHWEIAGTGVQIFSSGTVASGVTDQQAKMALSAHSTNGPTASGFAQTLQKMVETGEAIANKGAQYVKQGARVASSLA